MNLRHLVEAQKTLMAERGAEAESLCRQAYYCIAEAEAQGFTDKSLLKQAMHLFSEALRQQPGYTDACLGLAYLAILLEQQTLASRYLHLLLKATPDHPEALSLLEFLAHDTPGPGLDSAHTVNSDQLYDHLDHAILGFQRYWAQYAQIRPDECAASREHLLVLKAQLMDAMLYFETQLDLLEPEFETHVFRRRLRMGEALLAQFERALSLSFEMAHTLDVIRALHQDLRKVHLAIAEHKPGQEVQLESLCDRLERFQNQVLGFSEAGADTSNLSYALDIAQALLEQAHENLDAR